MVYSLRVPKVTVIVPLYNKAATIQRSLTSILGQTYSDWEAIVVNDGSTDSSFQLTQDWIQSAADPRFSLLDQSNQGPGAARNRGLAEARSELVAFLDADDDWLPHYLERGVAGFDAAGEPIAIHAQAWFDFPGGKSCIPSMRKLGLRDGIHSLTPADSPEYLVALMVLLWPCTTMVRRELALEYGGFREQRCLYAEDVHLWLKIALNHPFSIDLTESANFQHGDSHLSGNYKGMRHIEPFLEDPDDIRRHCPSTLRAILEGFLAIRAMKTACVLAYWGQWQRARALRSRFLGSETHKLPWFYASLLAASPAGALAGKLLRSLR